jgi:hypothetical protein
MAAVRIGLLGDGARFLTSIESSHFLHKVRLSPLRHQMHCTNKNNGRCTGRKTYSGCCCCCDGSSEKSLREVLVAVFVVVVIVDLYSKRAEAYNMIRLQE